MPTLSELKLKLAEVDRQLHATWMREREEARQRIADLAVEFMISPSTVVKDVLAAERRAPARPGPLRPPSVDLPLRQGDVPRHVEAKYRNRATGETWTGRGSRPRWLRAALDDGAAIEDFQLDTEAGSAPADPLRNFQDAARRSQATKG